MPIPNPEFIRVIPFEPPEAVSVELVSRKRREYTPAETEKMIPYLTCLTPEGVQEIITKAKLACRDDSDCEYRLDSAMDTVEQLDSLAEKLFGGLVP